MEGSYFEGGYTLKINDELISNKITLKKEFKSPNGFINLVCDYNEYEDCDAGGFIIACHHVDKLLFISMFKDKNTFEEYYYTDVNGDTNCPPQNWFTDGILEVEYKELDALLSLVSGLEKGIVKLIFESELATVFIWEKLVLDKPKGFIHENNLVTD